MDRAVGYSVLLRGFRLALSVVGLKPHTVTCYVRDAERLPSKHPDVRSVTAVRARYSRPSSTFPSGVPVWHRVRGGPASCCPPCERQQAKRDTPD